MMMRLIGFATALAPAWCIIGKTYFTAPFIKRGVRTQFLELEPKW